MVMGSPLWSTTCMYFCTSSLVRSGVEASSPVTLSCNPLRSTSHTEESRAISLMQETKTRVVIW